MRIAIAVLSIAVVAASHTDMPPHIFFFLVDDMGSVVSKYM
jgi:hypothetical protein